MKNIKKIIISIVFVTAILGGVAFMISQNNTSIKDNGKLKVAASYYPLYDFAKNIGGNKISVINMTPPGAEPHDFEPSPKALADASKSAVFIYNGGNLEPWTKGYLQDYKHTAIKASTGIALQAQDPHFWLDPVLAKQVVINIRDGLIKADPANSVYYTYNAADYIVKLAQLDQDYRNGLATCQTRTIITSHQAFSYLAKRYNLDVMAIAGISTDEEPSAAKLAELSQAVRADNIKYIFFESLASPKLADTIAKETGAKTLVFDPIEGLTNEAQKQGQDYISVQRQNLANLRTALACQ
ncbi:MAG TPA: zinc ABC transporter substrate-binding protein [Patescibacteria group bacterium]|jgi:zinc transport system substrate-binding protein|nr:zinc ABC transporter substrate-binding protein [Patescibacteria group bacterium]